METYFERGLTQASAGDQSHVLVFYCLENCWMSWNAAKRAMTLGYTHVAWYRDGTDGWEAQGFPTELRKPLPRPSASE
jgi:PQQ-dependent catabolism-associated CXXCW motif protein